MFFSVIFFSSASEACAAAVAATVPNKSRKNSLMTGCFYKATKVFREAAWAFEKVGVSISEMKKFSEFKVQINVWKM